MMSPARSSAARRSGVAVVSVVASIALAACGGPLGAAGGDWRSQARCQPQENPAPGDHAGDGPGLSPKEILPDRSTCPEAYGGGGGSGAPPVPGGDPAQSGGGGGGAVYPSPDPDHACAEGETLNGFPCHSVPGTGGGIYPGAPTEDRTRPQIPNY